MLRQGYVLTLTGKAVKAVEMVTSGIDLWRSAGSTIFTPEHEFMLAIAHADSGQFDDAWRCIGKAMTARIFDVPTSELAEFAQSGNPYYGIQQTNGLRVLSCVCSQDTHKAR